MKTVYALIALLMLSASFCFSENWINKGDYDEFIPNSSIKSFAVSSDGSLLTILTLERQILQYAKSGNLLSTKDLSNKDSSVYNLCLSTDGESYNFIKNGIDTFCICSSGCLEGRYDTAIVRSIASDSIIFKQTSFITGRVVDKRNNYSGFASSKFTLVDYNSKSNNFLVAIDTSISSCSNSDINSYYKGGNLYQYINGVFNGNTNGSLELISANKNLSAFLSKNKIYSFENNLTNGDSLNSNFDEVLSLSSNGKQTVIIDNYINVIDNDTIKNDNKLPQYCAMANISKKFIIFYDTLAECYSFNNNIEELSRFSLSSKVFSSIFTEDDSRLIMQTSTKQLSIIDLSDNKIIWHYNLPPKDTILKLCLTNCGAGFYALTSNDGIYSIKRFSDVTAVQTYNQDKQNISIYPNPSNSKIHIAINNPENRDCQLKLINCLGEQIANLTQDNFDSNILIDYDSSNLSNGVYYLVFDFNGIKKIEKICINK